MVILASFAFFFDAFLLVRLFLNVGAVWRVQTPDVNNVTDLAMCAAHRQLFLTAEIFQAEFFYSAPAPACHHKANVLAQSSPTLLLR